MTTHTDLFRLDGKVALITGGGGGFGELFARVLAQAGANLALVGRRAEVVDAVARTTSNETGQQVIGISADVTDAAQVDTMARQALDTFSQVDILINCAGVNVRKPTIEFPPEDWQRVLQVNLTGPFLCSRALAPQMLERGWGRVINVSSMLGLVGLGERPAYTAAKGGLIQLTRTMAIEWAPKGVTCNALAPGPFATEMNRPLIENPVAFRAMADRIPMSRWGELSELVGPILFLASEASSYMTGAVLTVDGGYTAW